MNEAKWLGLDPEIWNKYGKLGFKLEVDDPIEAIIKGIDPLSIKNKKPI